MEYPKSLIEASMGVGDLPEAEAIEFLDQCTPKERFDLYLQWNGILGHTETLWALAHLKVKTAETLQNEMLAVVNQQIDDEPQEEGTVFMLESLSEASLSHVGDFIRSFSTETL